MTSVATADALIMLVVDYLAKKYNFPVEEAMDDTRATILSEPKQNVSMYVVKRPCDNVVAKKETRMATYFAHRLRDNVVVKRESRMAMYFAQRQSPSSPSSSNTMVATTAINVNSIA